MLRKNREPVNKAFGRVKGHKNLNVRLPWSFT